MKRLAWMAGVTALAVVALLPTAVNASGGNSDAAHACQQGGYARFVAPGGGGFANTGECVSFAAHGGSLVTPTPTPPACPGSPGCPAVPPPGTF